MLHFTVETPVKGHFVEVFSRMNRNLFNILQPPGVPVTLERYDGEQPGDQIVVVLHLPLLPPQRWQTQITAREILPNEAYFTDASGPGDALPFFLARWQHRHRIVSDGPERSRIRDEVSFEGPRWLPDWLLLPVLWLQFVWRKPQYQKYFK